MSGTNKKPQAPSDAGPSMDAAAFNQLSAIFIHDFRNHLLMMRNSAETIIAQAAESSVIRDEAGQVIRGVELANALIENMAALSVHPSSLIRPVNINESIIQFEAMAARLLGVNRTIQLQLAPRLGPARMPDRLLEQILASLVMFASRTVPQGGKVSIRTFEAVLPDHDAECFLRPPAASARECSVVEISGPGIAADFEWAQVREAVPGSDALWASGLNDLMHRLLRRHGELFVKKTSPQEGVIRLYFQAERLESPTPVVLTPPPASGAGPHGSETILVAEDDPGARRVITRILQGHGYHVLEAENGASAIRTMLYHEGQVDLLLADVMMPDFDGPTLARQISSMRPGIKVIFASGFELADLSRQDIFLEGESVSLMKKPFRREELLQLVRGVLDQ